MVFRFCLVSMLLSVVYKVTIYADLMFLICLFCSEKLCRFSANKNTAPESQEIPHAFSHTVHLGHVQPFIVLVIASLCLLRHSRILLFSPVLC